MECTLRKNRYWPGLLLSAALAAPSGAAVAADNGFYLGLASSEVESNYDLGSAAAGVPDDDRGFKAIVGFRPVDSFALEANYVDFGKTRVPVSLVCVTPPCPTETAIDAQAVSVSAVGLLALPLLDLYARVGYARWEAEFAPFPLQERSGRDPTYGAGAQVRLGSFALRLEYERFELGSDDVDLTSIGFTYTFL